MIGSDSHKTNYVDMKFAQHSHKNTAYMKLVFIVIYD